MEGSAHQETPGDGTRLARASIILGALGVFTFGATAIVGFALGIAALVACHRRGAPRREVWSAVEGIVISLVVLPIGLVFALGLLWGRHALRQIDCYNRQESIGLSVLMYFAWYDERFHLALSWCDAAVVKYIVNPEVLRCPVAKHLPCGYTYNARLEALAKTRLKSPATVPMTFDGIGGWNAAGGPELFAPRHRGLGSIAYADGHVKWQDRDDLVGLTWKP